MNKINVDSLKSASNNINNLYLNTDRINDRNNAYNIEILLELSLIINDIWNINHNILKLSSINYDSGYDNNNHIAKINEFINDLINLRMTDSIDEHNNFINKIDKINDAIEFIIQIIN